MHVKFGLKIYLQYPPARVDDVSVGALSKVLIPSYDKELGVAPDDNLLSSRAQIKSVIYQEYMRGQNYSYFDSIKDSSFFNEEDIRITYCYGRLKEMSFSLEVTPVDKYDFVTLALRDIAKGLGFCCGIRGDIREKTLEISPNPPLPFESMIRNAIGTKNPNEAYINATKGNLVIGTQPQLKLYAPNNWINGVSLNCFIPDGEYKITELLNCEFGKGSVIRDISDSKYSDLFRKFLNWRPNFVVGSGDPANTVSSSGSTKSVLPYNGTLVIPYNNSYSQTPKISKIANYEAISSKYIGIDDLSKYCFKYHPYNIGNNKTGNPGGYSISILLKNGEWDVVYCKDIINSSESVKMKDMVFHYSDENYARTCDGYLRCRITFGNYDWLNRSASYDIRYIAIDYVPQSVETGISSYTPVEVLNEYVKKFNFGIKNLEGTTRVVVEQLTEGDRLPVRFEVPDFKKGYFTAPVDVDFDTQFTVIAYNKNGMTRGKTYTLKSLNRNKAIFEVKHFTHEIAFELNNERFFGIRKVVSYQIIPISSLSGCPMAGTIDENRIDIGTLPAGLYLLKYCDNTGNEYSYKFKME